MPVTKASQGNSNINHGKRMNSPSAAYSPTFKKRKTNNNNNNNNSDRGNQGGLNINGGRANAVENYETPTKIVTVVSYKFCKVMEL